MRFDIILTTSQRPGMKESDVFESAVETAVWAEELGYRGIWLLEHHFTRYALCNSAITMAAFLLGRTRTVRVGSAVTVVPLEHPVKLAERVAMLDHLSGGRFDFGVGRGAYVRDFDAFSVDMSVNHVALLDTMKDVVRAWGDEPFPIGRGADGAEQSLPVIPKPLTQPCPPVYVASGSPDAIAWAVSHGFPLLLREGLDDTHKVAIIDAYDRAAAATAEHTPAMHALTCVAVLDDSDSRALERARTHFSWWVAEGQASNGLLANRHRLPNYQTYFEALDAGRKAGAGDKTEFVNRMLSPNLIGSPRRCRERLSEICETTGIRHIVLGFDANEPGEATRTAMERFMHEVLEPVAAGYPE
jgi:alkanal monooxygenase alpha chain